MCREKTCSRILLSNIQRFSLHDGPGIRTAVFLKGCSLRCPWCSNPENISHCTQAYVKDSVKGVYGSWYTADELYAEVMKDKLFYEGKICDFNIHNSDQIDFLPGGVTFTGGECLLQIEALLPLLRRLHREHVHTAMETSLFVPEKVIHIAVKYIDFFYVDIKILDEVLCREYLQGALPLYLSNFDLLLSYEKPTVIRVPVIGGYTDSDQNRKRVVELLTKYIYGDKTNILKIELIKEHNLGAAKYQSLEKCNVGYEVPEYKGVSDVLMELYRKEIVEKISGRVPVEICAI